MRVRSIFISDIHLGTRACQAGRLLEFLNAYDCEQLFLVGDVIVIGRQRGRGPCAFARMSASALKRIASWCRPWPSKSN